MHRLALLLLLPLPYACSSEETSSTGAPPQTPSCEPGAACTTVESACLALVDNKDRPKAGLRIGHLTVTQPAALAKGIVARTVARRVTLDAPQCNLAGGGTFSWLFEIDRKTGATRTGGAPVSKPHDGYCFVNGTISGRQVAPAETTLKTDGGSFTFAPFDVVLPIFLDPAGETSVLLPLTNVTIEGEGLDEAYNCVGTFNADGLRPETQCFGDEEHPSFIGSAKISGSITLEDADTVDVPATNSSLCVVLSGDALTYGDGQKPVARCRKDAEGKLVLQGDWCSTTDSADGCRDSFRLGAEFAASAVEIKGDCE